MARLALQLLYTSCRRGLGVAKGFQIRACSPGIDPAEQSEIVSRAGYAAPSGLPPEPTPAEIEAHYPVVLRSYRLSSGRWALTRSQYSGQEFSTRWGNYFAHTLVFDDGPMPMYPIDYREWEGWEQRLDPADDTDDPPPVPPLVDLRAFTPTPSFGLEDLRDFLLERPGRAAKLEAMVRAVFFGKPRSRALVVRDSMLDGPFWIACIQKAFPLPIARELTMSTYQFEPRGSADINATTPGTDFVLNEMQRNFQFCAFDMGSGASSDIPSDGEEYATTVVGWMAGDIARLAAFHEFTRDLRAEATPDLVHPLRLFRIASAPDEKLLLSDEALAQALDFARDLSPQQRARLVDPLHAAAVRAALDGEAKRLAAIWAFLGPAAGSAPVPLRSQVVAAWLACFDAVVAADGWRLWTALEQARVGLSVSAEAWRAIAEGIQEDLRVLSIADAFRRSAAVPVRELVRLVLASAEATGQTRAWGSSSVVELLGAAAVAARKDRAKARALLSAFGFDGDAIASVLEHLLEDGSERPTLADIRTRAACVGAAFFDHVAAATPEERRLLHAKLDRRRTWPVLDGACAAALEADGDKVAHYARSVENLFREAPDFAAAHGDAIAERHFRALDGATATRQAAAWIARRVAGTLADPLRTDVVRAVAAALPLRPDDPGTRSMANAVTALAEENHIELSPDRPMMLRAIDMVREPTEGTAPEIWEALPGQLAALGASDYPAFLALFLRPAIAHARTVAAHERLVRAALVSTRGDAFSTAYADALAAAVEKTISSDVLEAALLFWLRVRPSGKNSRRLRDQALRALINAAAAMDREGFAAIEQRLDEAVRSTPGVAGEWSNIRNEIAEKRRSFLGRITSFFRSPKA